MEDINYTPLIQTGIVLILTLVAYLIALWAGRRFIARLEVKGPERGARAATLWLMIRRVILAVLVVTSVLIVFGIWGLSIAPFLALGTIFAAAIGFGAQDVVKDVLAGFFILAEDQYHIGDTVTIAGTTGSVQDIQFRVTVLRDHEGVVHYISNGQITLSSNYTSVFAQPVLDVGVAYSADVDHAMAVMLDELQNLGEDPEWGSKIRGPAEMLGVNELGDSSVVIRGRLTTVAVERWSVRREALRRIKNRFDAEGIEIPFPQLTVHQRSS